jgi:hypothetical protein
VVLDEVQGCILDNFWYQYKNRREEKGCMLSILNNLAEYFNMMNGKIHIPEEDNLPEHKPLYLIFNGKQLGIYMHHMKNSSFKIKRNESGRTNVEEI